MSSNTKQQRKYTDAEAIAAVGVHVSDFDGNISEIYNSLGDLKIQPNTQGNLVLFGDTDVGDAVNGKMLYVHRQAVEGDDYIRLYVSNSRAGIVSASADLTAYAVDSVTLQSAGKDVIFRMGDDAGAKGTYFKNSSNAIVGSVDSLGNAEFNDLIATNIKTPILETSGSTLKIQPGADADVVLFSSADVDNAADGKELKIWRNAAEGNNYIRTYITSTQNALIHSNTNILLQNASGSNIQLNSGQHIYLNMGDQAGSDEVRIRDSAGLEVGTIDSNGNVWYRGDLSIGVDSDVLIQANGLSYFNGGSVGIGVSPTEFFHVEKDYEGILVSKFYNSNANGIAQHLVGANGGGQINLIANSGPGTHLGIPVGGAGISVDWGNMIVFAVGDSGSSPEKMRLTPTGLGIGTIPTALLTLKGSEASAHGNAAALSIENSADGGDTWYLRSGATGTNTPVGGFSIADTTAYRFVIDENGNVGIGTTTPGLPLEVRSADDNQAIFFDSRAQAQGVGGGLAFGGKYNDVGGEAMAGRIGAQKVNGTSGNFDFDVIIEAQNTAEGMTEVIKFLSTGNVNIPNDLIVGGNINGIDIANDLAPLASPAFTGDFTVDTDTFFVDSANNRIGIGITTPNRQVHLKSNRPGITFEESDAGSNEKVWQIDINSEEFMIKTANDLHTGTQSIIKLMNRAGTGVGLVAIPNSPVSIGTESSSGKLHVDQANASGARPVLTLDQGDLDWAFIEFLNGTTYTEKSGQNEYLKVLIGGNTRYLRLFN